ncbi:MULTISPECIES: asparagine synthase (glutamine-hydrolyzing) [unclassified Carboxylicivirga]|uniref:asparagine synthase (glutamine-hydrolyzing) n=1 Tax=Carboxylicivirga TaxID=1628153 RepID=UPI003D3410DA
MCGITGYINTNQAGINDTSQIVAMLKVQRHRGPDDSGVRAFNLQRGCSVEVDSRNPAPLEDGFDGMLGFNRLSILDLSENGHQPMLSPDSNVLLAFNGEIYNAFDFKNELENWGYRFKSNTDTEVILALYLKYGLEETLGRLNGMFAIAIADLNKQTFYLARDRFGIKPMYYINSSRRFAFSSELKSFGCLEGFSFALNSDKLDEYMLFRNTLHDTLFEGVRSLQPGSYICYRPGKEIKHHSFFNVNNYERCRREGHSAALLQHDLKGWLEKSVHGQLMSDVKLGCQLSGGIDSSLVTWLANHQSSSGNFESVSIVFNDARFSEEKYINRVRDTLGITAHKFLLNSDYYLQHIEKATWHLEAPLNHPNTIGIYQLSQRAKAYVTVLLSGEGADEVFGGYERFHGIKYPYAGLRLLRQVKNNIKQPAQMLSYFKEAHRAVMATAYMQPHLALQLLPGFTTNKASHDRLQSYASLRGTRFDRQVKYEMQTYLPDLLIRQDKMSMAHSIENRVPFLDNEVVSRSFSIPEKFLLSRNNGMGSNSQKYLLKQMTAEVFGHPFAFRDKMGFGIPLREFFMKDDFSQYLNDKIVPGIKSRGIFNGKKVQHWVEHIKTIKPSELDALWVAMAFETWASVYLDGK